MPGPTVERLAKIAKQYGMAMVVPVYERVMPGVYYNTAAVLDHDGSYLGKYRKSHLPHCAPGFWEKFYFRPGNLGYPVFQTKVAKIGVYICYDRHFPEGARCLGLNGAEIVFNPSATVAGLAVAIPALFAYNWFAIKIKNISSDLAVFSDEFLTRSAELHNDH